MISRRSRVFAAQRAYPAFGDRIRPRCPARGADDGDVDAGEHGSKAAVNSASRSRIKNQVGHRRVHELQHVEAADVRRDRPFHAPEAASSRRDAA